MKPFKSNLEPGIFSSMFRFRMAKSTACNKTAIIGCFDSTNSESYAHPHAQALQSSEISKEKKTLILDPAR